MARFVEQTPGKVRKDPLGPAALNQAHVNIETVGALIAAEHLDDGAHNLEEVPWVVGHVDNATTGYLFDTAFGGGAISRPSTGEATINVASGVIDTATGYNGVAVPAAAVLANVSDADIANTPHLIEVEMVSATSIRTRVQRLITTLGTQGNAWELVARAFDIASHSTAQSDELVALSPYSLKARRDFITEAASDWNSLVSNQALLRSRMMLEHTSAGEHLSDRIAKAEGWFKPVAGPSYSIVTSKSVAEVNRISSGVVEVTLQNGLDTGLNLAACFAQINAANDDEMTIINGRLHSASKFRFYLYKYTVSENIWDRIERPFFAAMFGRLA